MKKLAVVAIGGNAVNRPGEKPTAENMLKNLSETAKYIVNMIDEYDVAITHGNGPQVGNLLVQQEIAKDKIPPFPIDVNDAQTQGSLGYMIAQSIRNQLKAIGKDMEISAVVTQIIVDKNDPAFQNPTKPVGPFYTEEEAKMLEKEKGWKIVEDAGRGWRRVVPSPKPLDIVEKDVIKLLMKNDVMVIAAGGGGIPVIVEDNKLKGVEAVIDKDRASALLAKEVDADILIILTGVEKVYLNFGKEDQKALDKITTTEAKKFLQEGHFPKGSMGPKIEAAIDFVESTGKECLITDMSVLDKALRGETGTRIIKG
ncbi:carbamate kinase [Thermosipho melanesiensis]|uniref:Carbamate kinase n=2 Tax=Thermosipho melanesiensis TaxID=46541 RepID=A6LPA8_THEM4|nr:carbamate kinase [Thermosipho melanesiensis]ABR31759.1 carbamate kinase [Thermosipho melanesiensis BI429]APT74781.1 carbamate kinase [Thermosipho melanesiensis]OOC35098.1 carbamate kinase [Thermosipho melanesiensis]OOC35134.1 carbamate kinase [Thermosipho melanesiensis]OOC36742.1 carbamate kinase [Thermosipho melanesiensis]